MKYTSISFSMGAVISSLLGRLNVVNDMILQELHVVRFLAVFHAAGNMNCVIL